MSSGLQRLKLTVSYDGRPFRGWQSQASGDAVQDHLEAAFRDLCGHRIVVHGSGRTDTGVHAIAQTAHVDVPANTREMRTWQLAINTRLPEAVRVMRVQKARPDFHARFSAKGKRYLYRICPGPSMPPLEIGRAWHMPAAVDWEQLCAGARVLEGTHDFARFAANRGVPSARDTVRTISFIRLARRAGVWELVFEGDGFLYKMVRLLTGSLIRCAQGRETTDWLRRLLEDPATPKTHFLAPAEGLYLVKVLY